MSSGAKSGEATAETAMRRSEAQERQAQNDEPLQDFSIRGRADAVLSRADPVSARDQVYRDMSGMMRYFRVDPRQIPPRFAGALRAARRVCAQCVVVERCQRWFGLLSDDAPRSFCPNAGLYEGIAASQRQRADQ